MAEVSGARVLGMGIGQKRDDLNFSLKRFDSDVRYEPVPCLANQNIFPDDSPMLSR